MSRRIDSSPSPAPAVRARPASPYEVAGQIAAEFRDGAQYVDLAPITEPDLVPVTTARTLGLPDVPGRSATDTLVRFITDQQMLLVLDNCEHLLDATAALVVAHAPGLPWCDRASDQP